MALDRRGSQPGLVHHSDRGVQYASRDYTAEYKQRILEEAEVAAATRGGLGALLRREGLYSSLRTYWRRERAQGILEALTPQQRGPKSKRNPREDENQKLRRQNARLTEDLRKAPIINVQKKVAALLGNPIRDVDPEEKSVCPPLLNWPWTWVPARLARLWLCRAPLTTEIAVGLLLRP